MTAALVNDGNVVRVEQTSGPTSQGRRKSAVMHRSVHHEPLRVVHAEGHYLQLSNGQRILDATGGAAVACIGHGDLRVKAAVARQMDEVSYCHTLFYTTSAAEKLADLLVQTTEGHMSKAFVCSSGSEAMEAAMKLARQYFMELSQPQRTKFIARKESYHGTTLGALSMSGHVARRALYEPMLLDNVSRVSACNVYRGLRQDESEQEYVDRLAQELDDEFTRLGPDTVCAFVAEPVVGAALGCVPAPIGYLQAMKRICAKHGALLILDEVMCGMGRTGYTHAWQIEGIVPDIQTLGKGLGGGYAPCAAVLMNHKIVAALTKGTGAFGHGQTYQAHPVACAAAAEVVTVIRQENLVRNVKDMGAILGELLQLRLGKHRYVGDIRGRGLFWGIEFVKDKATKTPFEPKEAIAMGIHEKGMTRPYNISIYPGTGSADGGKAGDHVLLAPPYNVTRQDIENIVDLTTRVIEDYFNERAIQRLFDGYIEHD